MWNLMLNWGSSERDVQPRKLRLPVQRHLGINLADAQAITHEIKPVQRVNLQRVLDQWVANGRPPVQACGFSSSGSLGLDDSVAKYLMSDELVQAPMEWAALECAPGQTLDCVVRGLFLLRRDDVPVAIAFRRPARFSNDLPVLEVIAAAREAARATLTALLDEAQRGSVYKGRILAVEYAGLPSEGPTLRFQEVRPAGREDIVLPEELLRVVERNIFGMLKHAEALRGAGRSLRRGLLFHGSPGTGKSLLVRYLVQASKGHTVLLLTGTQPGLVREACQLARLLAPTIMVLEDVDLVAEAREQNRYPVILLELMNEMDGLGVRDEVTFVLTTNRPEVLESALTARPGRIDQAIAFPLPDEGCRRRLFEMYGRGLDLSAADLERWVSQTNGVSPAFIEELLRKAALLAAERGEANRPLRINEVDIEGAIRELVYFGGELTQRLLGYHTGRIGYQSSSGNR
jgi:cell division protease FtsH